MNDAIAFVIFGVTGDLASRKLIPALYRFTTASQNHFF
jgi:glucose-6-phosphate 1-dehydrogenase